jgi:hypothetical protein
MRNLLLALAMVATFAIAAASSLPDGQAGTASSTQSAECCTTQACCGQCDAACK